MFRDLQYRIVYKKGSDIASASTLVIPAGADYFQVTGTTGITRLHDMGKGQQVELYFESQVTLTHDATYLDLGGSDVTTDSGGESIRFIQYDDGDGTVGKWRLLSASTASSPSGTGTFTSDDTEAKITGGRIDVNGDFTTDLSSWTHDTDWNWNAANGGCARHTAVPFGDSSLVGYVPVVDGNYYYGELTVANRTAGNIVVSIGSYIIPVDGETNEITTNGTHTGSVRAYSSGNADVEINPSADFDGDIVSVKFWRVDDPAVPQVVMIDEAGTTSCTLLSDDDLNNTFIGTNGGLYAYGGQDNICVGKDAGVSLITGSYNTFIGKDAGESCTMGIYNTCVGNNAGAEIVMGSANTVVGADAGINIIGGKRNTLVGTDTGASITAGYSNTYIGSYAGDGTTTGSYNVAVGDRCLRSLTTAQYNIAIGVETLNGITAGTGNVAIGHNTLESSTGVQNNTAVGREAMNSAASGDYNTALGYRAGYGSFITTSTGSGNVFLGASTGNSITTGSWNTLIGQFSGHNLAGGDYNIIIGYKSGEYTAGTTPLTGVEKCIYIGREIDGGSISAENEIVIGDEAVGRGSDTITLGNSSHTDTYLKGIVHTAGQVEFPATQNASSDAHTLDDYEEGTFAPAINFGGDNTGVTYATRSGTYTKIGNVVTCVIVMTLSNKGSDTGAVTITGLPFSAEKNTPCSFYVSNVTFSTTLQGYVATSGEQIYLKQIDGATGTNSNLTDDNIANNSGIIVNVTYIET